MKKLLFTICFILCFTPLCAHAAWYDGELAGLRQQGFINAAHFENPDSPILREEICDILVSLYKFQNPQATIEQNQNSFTDTQNSPYKTSIDTAYSLGLINGTSETTFDGKGTLTREQFATIIYRMHGSPLAPVRAYRDEPEISEYALQGIDYCVQQGIVKGTAKDYFSPKKTLTKAEALVMVNRLLSMEPTQEDAQFLRYIIEDKDFVYTVSKKTSGLSILNKNTSERKVITFDKSIAGQIYEMDDMLVIPKTPDTRYDVTIQGGYLFNRKTGKITEYDSPIFHWPIGFYNDCIYFSEFNYDAGKITELGKFNVKSGETTYGEPIKFPDKNIEFNMIFSGKGNKLYGATALDTRRSSYINPLIAFEIDLDALEIKQHAYPDANEIAFIDGRYTGYVVYDGILPTSIIAIHDTQTGEKIKEIDCTQLMNWVPNETISSRSYPVHYYSIGGEIYIEDAGKRRLICLTKEEMFDICVGIKDDENLRYNYEYSDWVEIYNINGKLENFISNPENNLTYSSVYNREYFVGDYPLSHGILEEMEIFKAQKYYWTTYKTPTEIVNAVNKYLTDNCVYDYDTYRNTPLATADSHCSIGVIRNQKAVCQGFAEYFEEMLSYSGIPVKTITGIGNGGLHGWNLVYLDGKHYYFDCTNNVSYKDENAFAWRSLAEFPHTAEEYYNKFLK